MSLFWINLLAAAGPWVLLVLLVGTAAFFSGVETGAYRLNRVRLRLAEQEGRPGARLLGKMLADLPGVICVTLLGVNVATYVATIVSERLWRQVYPTAHDEMVVELLTSVTLAPALFIFADLVPKDIFNNWADRLMYPAARPLWVADVFFRGVGLVSLLKGHRAGLGAAGPLGGCGRATGGDGAVSAARPASGDSPRQRRRGRDDALPERTGREDHEPPARRDPERHGSGGAGRDDFHGCRPRGF